MKILLCSPTYECVTHGPAKFAKHIFNMPQFIEDVEVRILTEDIQQEVPQKIYKYARSYPRGIGVFWEYWDNFLLVNRIRKIQEEYAFDVVIFNNAVQGWLASKKLSARILKIGMINDNEYITNDLSQISFTKEWFIKWKSRLLEKRAAATLDLIISNSDFLRNEIIESYGMSSIKVKRLYKSIDLRNFPFIDNRIFDSDKQIEILFIKNDYRRGGLLNLIKALNLLQDYSFILNFAGMDEKEHRLIQHQPVKAHVKMNYLGKISQTEVRRQMNINHILCIPALREGLGVANIEGLASGIPVVSSDAGGIPEVLDQGKNGWLASKNNIDSLAKVIEDCVVNEDERKQKSLAGRKFVEANFNHMKMIKSLHDIISKERIEH